MDANCWTAIFVCPVMWVADVGHTVAADVVDETNDLENWTATSQFEIWKNFN